MSLKEKNLAVGKLQKEREQIAILIKAYEGEKWNGFLGGVKGIFSCLILAVVFSFVAVVMGNIFHSEFLSSLCVFWGVCAGLIISQIVRNYKNGKLDTNISNLKREYWKLTKMTKEVIYTV